MSEGKSQFGPRLTLAAAVLVICWLAMIIVREENQRYAMSIGMCPDAGLPYVHDFKCMAEVETRTEWFFHLYYAAQKFGSP